GELDRGWSGAACSPAGAFRNSLRHEGLVAMGFFREREEDLGPPPPPFQMGDRLPPRRNQRWIVLVGILLLLVLAGGAAKELYTDFLWFDSVGYTSVFITTLGARV